MKKETNTQEFCLSFVGIDHPHVYELAEHFVAAGSKLCYVWDRDRKKAEALQEKFPNLSIASTKQEVYDCERTTLIISSIVANERIDIGLEAHKHGKHYMADKPAFTTLEQLEKARRSVAQTGLKWSVAFTERLGTESSVMAQQLIDSGEIGRVIQVTGFGPHLLNKANRPSWFFNKEQYGGIIADIGSHQIDQILSYAGAKSGKVIGAQVGNHANADTPELEDFGEVMLSLDTGASGYGRVDWFTPDGLDTWGDGRTFILGTNGYIEIRKYIDINHSLNTDNIYLVNNKSTQYINAKNTVGLPFFKQFIEDCVQNTEKAISQEHVFQVCELSLLAQNSANILGKQS